MSKLVAHQCDKCGHEETLPIWFWEKVARPIHARCGGQFVPKVAPLERSWN